MEQVKFAFADMHGNLKIRLKQPLDSDFRYVLNFSCEDNVNEIKS